MGFPLIGYTNYVKTASLTVDNAATGLDQGQLQNNDAGAASMAWQTLNAAGKLTVTLPAAAPWRVAAFARTNITAAAYYYVSVYTDATRATLVYGTGLIPANVVAGQCVSVLPAGISGAYLELFVSDPTSPEGFLNIPLVFAGPAFQPVRNFSWGTTRGRDQRVDEIVTRSGVEFPQHRWQRRRLSLDAQSIDPTEYATYAAIDSQARLGGNVLFIPDQASATINADSVFGRLTPKADFGYMPGGQRLTWKADITERL